ncbi:MAG TPA: hypothetical protein PLZ95_03085 [Bryobacteraceae bacterium]|nr:hypothetical protein [Bryobacteraceae bacterium]
MKREEIDRLLARLSSGELTPAEREALYNAALDDQTLFEEIFAEQALAEALSDRTIRDEFLSAEQARDREATAAAKADRRRIPWWGWAVPAAVAASTIIGVILLREPAREAQVAQKPAQQPIEVAQSQPRKTAPESASAPAPQPVGPAKHIAVAEETANAIAAPTVKGEVAELMQKKSEPVLMARRDEAKSLDLKDQAVPPRANEEPPAPPTPESAPKPAAPRAVGAGVGATQTAGRSAEAESRPAQVAEFRAAAPVRQMEAREASDAAVRKEAVTPARAKTVAAERDEALALRSSAGLQAQDATGNWQDVPSGGRVARDAKLRVKVIAHEQGSWTLVGKDGRSVQLAANETAYLDLPSSTPGLNSVDLTFRPGSQAVMRLRSATAGGRLGRVRISFTIE